MSSSVKKWTKEYQQSRGLPSSFRDKPSFAAKYFYDFWRKKRRENKGRVLDVGCGKGRNSFFFAVKNFSVDCLEIIPEMVAEINKQAKIDKLKVKAICQDATRKMPFKNNFFDVVLDIYVYRYHVDQKRRAFFRRELARVLKPDGYYLLAVLDVKDGFYGSLLKNSPDLENKIIVDPQTKIPSFLSTKKDIEKEFLPDFEIINFLRKKEKSPMHGKMYSRNILFFIMKRRGKD